MKRVAIAAVLVVVMVIGVVAYAIAAPPNDVVVTAKVNPKMSMTIGTTAIDFGDGVAPIMGTTPTGTSLISVKSNTPWTFTKSVSIDPLLTTILTDTYDQYAPTYVGAPVGWTDITATYTLDLTAEDAYDLVPNTAYTATYTYTVAP